MAEDHDGRAPTLAAQAKHDREMSDYYEMRDRIIARVAHLDPYPRMAIERAVRVLRAYFIDRRNRAPRHGTLEGLMLVGKNADPAAKIAWDREPLLFEIWAFVDHEAYKGKERYWGRAQAVLRSQLGRAIEVELSVFTIAEAGRFLLTNSWLAERYDGGIVLYDRAMDPPRSSDAEAAHERIANAAEALDEPQRIAFQRYRTHGFDLGRISRALRTSEAEARMILAEAFGALLAEVGDEARTRTLRSHLGNHPRHNLDLYHRPGDFDRLLAVTFYRRAVDHVGMMVEAHARDRAGKIVQEAAYATEFALKALLLHVGYSEDWNRRFIGLDLEGTMRHARANGLEPPSDELERLITPLSDYHRGGRTPDQARAVLTALPPAEIVETAATLVADVGTITGYAGLLGGGIAMMLHTDLDHLSGSMREELRRVTALLFEGFDDLCAQKRAQRYKTARIDKLILYGAHADRDQASIPMLTPAPIRLLVVVNHNRIAARRDDWAPIRDRLRRAWEVGEITHPVRLCVHTLSHVNHALVHGVPWFVTIATDGIALYQASSARLEAPRRLPAARQRERGHGEFVRWYDRAGDFLIGAAFFEKRGNAPMAALLLHQANEHLYQCVAWSLTLGGLRTHALDELREVAEYLDSRLALAWPQETPFERRVFGCIRRAYVEVRYGRSYRITPAEVAWAMDCTAALYKLVQAVCIERLEALEEGPQEADHVQFA